MPRKRGPSSSPRTIKFTAGNDPSQRKVTDTVTDTVTDRRAPTCPRWLSKDAQHEWQRIMPLLKDLGHCSLEYRAAIAAYCQCYSRWKEAEQLTDEHGLTIPTPNNMLVQAPWVSVANRAKADMLKWCVELGITPATAAKTGGKSKGTEPDDEYEAFRRSKRG